MEDVLSMGFCILQNIFVPLQYSFKLGVLYMVTTSVNKELIILYYNIGKIITKGFIFSFLS